MKKHWKIAVVGLLALAAGSFWLGSRRTEMPSPSYQGKSAEQWFYGERGHPGFETTMKAADVAFKAMGTNAVPFLLQKLRTKETGLNEFYGWLHPKLPRSLQVKLKPPLKASYIQIVAFHHWDKNNRKLDPWLGELMAVVPGLDDPGSRQQAIQFIGKVGWRSVSIERQKSFFLSFLGDRDFRVQFESALALADLDPKLTNAVPVLVMAVTNTSLMATNFPNLFVTSAIIQPNPATGRQKAAHDALTRIAPAVAETLPRPK